VATLNFRLKIVSTGSQRIPSPEDRLYLLGRCEAQADCVRNVSSPKKIALFASSTRKASNSLWRREVDKLVGPVSVNIVDVP
jgi:hypothetical protein